MSDNPDLRALLESWPYDSDDDTRVIKAGDGREVLQVRTPLGIEQYELDGRPDGLRPHEAESEFEFQLGRFEQGQVESSEEKFVLNADECADLIAESTLYYYRYVRFFQVKDWPRAIRDTSRNLQVFNFVHRHASREEDRNYLEKWRPYLMRMNAMAKAFQHIEHGRHVAALGCVNRALQAIEAMEEMEDEIFDFERECSLEALRELSKQIQSNRPISKKEQLERQLQRAIEDQEFERAAELRDRLRELNSKPA